MPFRFKRKESVAKGVRRIGRERIEDALECLEECDDPEAIHCARKDIKKVRAVLRLVKSELKKKELRPIIRPLRKAAQLMAGPREAYINLKTIGALTEHFKRQVAPGAFRQVRQELRQACDSELKRFARENTTRAVGRWLRNATKELDSLNIKGKGWKALGPGIKEVYAGGIRGYKKAVSDGSAEVLHEWRKRVKDLWYDVRLLCRVWPEQMEAMAEELELLGEHLGDYHDLVLLGEALKDQRDRHRREWETVQGLILERQRELANAALALGGRFYAEKPLGFCNRLAGYWHMWRGEQKRGPVADKGA